jgi:hypothetical protein
MREYGALPRHLGGHDQQLFPEQRLRARPARQTLMLSPIGNFRPARTDWLQAGLVGCGLFFLYAATAPRTVAFEDDGLFIMSSYFLGIEHPPGYPLFTLIGHLFSGLPFGSVAYRVHLASALFGGLTCAVLWLCARTLIAGRLPAYVAALGLGFSPVFWSQSVIAEVYTLNTFLLLTIVYLGLQVCGPGQRSPSHAKQAWVLAGMAFLFGLSLSNHYPLMLLVAPALCILLWPLREQVLQRLGLLVLLALVGLLPYAWLVRRSWLLLPISFNGPLETLPEIFYFLSRAGYAGVDDSASAGWLDRARFLQFLGGQLFVQFAVVGTLLAAAGFAAQWRVFGRRIGAFLTLAFLMPSVVLLFLLNFDYSAFTKHMFHVYPLPAYAVVALWMALGVAWLAQRRALSRVQTGALAALALGAILIVGARASLSAGYEFAARYAQVVLRTLPKDAVLFVGGDADLPIVYFYLVEGLRPDIVPYHSGGLVLGNRLFHPLRTPDKDAQGIVQDFIERQKDPVALTSELYPGFARRERWLFMEVDRSSRDPNRATIDIPEEAVGFFEEWILYRRATNAFTAAHQDDLRRRYASLLVRSLPRQWPVSGRQAAHLAALSEDFSGVMGILEGMMLHAEGYSARTASEYLARLPGLMPTDAGKAEKSRFFSLRGVLRQQTGDNAGAVTDWETAFALWPVEGNRAITALEDTYGAAGNKRALDELHARIRRPRQ